MCPRASCGSLSRIIVSLPSSSLLTDTNHAIRVVTAPSCTPQEALSYISISSRAHGQARKHLHSHGALFVRVGSSPPMKLKEPACGNEAGAAARGGDWWRCWRQARKKFSKPPGVCTLCSLAMLSEVQAFRKLSLEVQASCDEVSGVPVLMMRIRPTHVGLLLLQLKGVRRTAFALPAT